MAKSCKIPKLSGTLTNGQWLNAQSTAVSICERRHVPMHVVCSSSKLKQIVSARDEIIRLLNSWGWSTTQIGDFVRKTHSAIVYALQRMEKARLQRPDGVHLEHDNQTERGDANGGNDSGRCASGDTDDGGPDTRPNRLSDDNQRIHRADGHPVGSRGSPRTDVDTRRGDSSDRQKHGADSQGD